MQSLCVPLPVLNIRKPLRRNKDNGRFFFTVIEAFHLIENESLVAKPMGRLHGYSPVAANTVRATAHSLAENSVGVLPVTWRNACENAGTLA
jgi:hypothetical protein